jgi:K+-sensing histidine kinase KdpD
VAGFFDDKSPLPRCATGAAAGGCAVTVTRKLVIFLGYVAGVGKTYGKLEAARQRRAEGTDVVASYVETHGRAETEALLEGLETVLEFARKHNTTKIVIGKPVRAPWVELLVGRPGVGIPPEDLELVFDKFCRVKRSAIVGGTGLGLSMCKGIVEAHRGQIRAENRPGGGMIVSLTLPIQRRKTALEEERI